MVLLTNKYGIKFPWFFWGFMLIKAACRKTRILRHTDTINQGADNFSPTMISPKTNLRGSDLPKAT